MRIQRFFYAHCQCSGLFYLRIGRRMELDYMGTLAIVVLLSMFGGLIDSIMRYRRDGQDLPAKTLLLKTFFDLLIAAFAGALTFWVMEYMTDSRELNGLMCAAISLSGYLGGNAINIAAATWKAVLENSVPK